MSDTLDAIEANWDSMSWPPYGARAEVAYLLDLARKQQAAIDAVKAMHKPIDSGDLRIVGPVCAECSEVDDYMFTFHPCPTVEALDAKL